MAALYNNQLTMSALYNNQLYNGSIDYLLYNNQQYNGSTVR